MSKLWMTVTGQRCPHVWTIGGVNALGARRSKDVRCDRPRGHAGRCVNRGLLHYGSSRHFWGNV